MRSAEAFRMCAREYLNSIVGVLSVKTVENYTVCLEMAARDVESLGLEPDPSLWGEPEILAVRDAWVQRYAPVSVASRFSALNGLLLHSDNGVIEAMRRRRRLRLPTPSRTNVRWTDEDTASSLIARSEGNVRMVLVLGYGLGLRRGEIAGARLSDMRTGYLDVVGKGDKPRTLPLDGWVLEELNHHLEKRGWGGPDRILVHGKDPRGYTSMGIYRMVQRHGERNGVRLSCHEMRRTFALALRRRGVPLERIQELLGHESIETTRKYIMVELEELREALQILYPNYLAMP